MQAAHVEEQANNIEVDLKVERDWRISLQDTIQHDREKISKLQTELSQLKMVAQVNKFMSILLKKQNNCSVITFHDTSLLLLSTNN